MKQLRFVNEAARSEARTLPLSIRRALGFQLLRIQRGETPSDFKSMTTVGQGVYELRLHDGSGANTVRCFYVAKFDETIWVLHTFMKKSQSTPRLNLEVGQLRYRFLIKIIKGP